jgi:hypothetical protein
MQNISLPYLFVAASLLDRLQDLPSTDTKIEDAASVLIDALRQVVELHAPQSVYAPQLRSAYTSGDYLVQAITPQGAPRRP